MVRVSPCHIVGCLARGEVADTIQNDATNGPRNLSFTLALVSGGLTPSRFPRLSGRLHFVIQPLAARVGFGFTPAGAIAMSAE